MFSFPIHPSLFIRIFHSHPFPHSFTPTLSSSLALGRRRKRRAGRRGRYFHTSSMSLSLPMLGLARRRSRSRLVFLGMGMALGMGTALLLLFGFVVIPSGDERVDLFFQKLVSWMKRRGEKRKKKKKRLTKPTSSNKFGKIQIALFIVNTVTHQNTNLTTASPKNAPISPNTPTLKYHTPILSFTGQSGNMTPANMISTMANPPR